MKKVIFSRCAWCDAQLIWDKKTHHWSAVDNEDNPFGCPVRKNRFPHNIYLVIEPPLLEFA